MFILMLLIPTDDRKVWWKLCLHHSLELWLALSLEHKRLRRTCLGHPASWVSGLPLMGDTELSIQQWAGPKSWLERVLALWMPIVDCIRRLILLCLLKSPTCIFVPTKDNFNYICSEYQWDKDTVRKCFNISYSYEHIRMNFSTVFLHNFK